MDTAKLPTENAHEPTEEAFQPSNKFSAAGLKSKCITFANNIELSPKSFQRNNFKEVLSQPPHTLTHKQRLQWLQERRGMGLWVQCDACNSWRYIPQALDSNELPDVWYCSMNSDPNYANCAVPEVPLHIHDEEDLIHAEYSAGSIVWARLTGWPWWPAMIDDCPDTEQFYWLDGLSDIPTHYNAVFFDGKDVTRAWIAPEHIKPFTTTTQKLINNTRDKKYHKRLDVAVKQANDANSLPLANRLSKYSFIARFKGNIYSPRKIDKRHLKKYQSALKRKYNVEFPQYSSDSDDSITNEITEIKPKRKTNKVDKTNNNKKKDTYTIKKVNNKENMSKPTNVSTGDKHEDVNIKDRQATNNKENVILSTMENTTADFFKPPNSQESENIIENTSNIDNDTSATYVPDTQIENTLEDRNASPNSDDFDF